MRDYNLAPADRKCCAPPEKMASTFNSEEGPGTRAGAFHFRETASVRRQSHAYPLGLCHLKNTKPQQLFSGFGQVGLWKPEVISGTPFQVPLLYEGLPSFSPSRCNVDADGACGRLAPCGVCFGKSQPQPSTKVGANVRCPGQLSLHSSAISRYTRLVAGALGSICLTCQLALWVIR